MNAPRATSPYCFSCNSISSFQLLELFPDDDGFIAFNPFDTKTSLPTSFSTVMDCSCARPFLSDYYGFAGNPLQNRPLRDNKKPRSLRCPGFLGCEECHACVHFRADVFVRLEEFDFYLNGRLLPIRFRSNFINMAIVRTVGISIRNNRARLVWVDAIEVVLVDIEFNLDIIEIRKCDNESFGSLIANKRRGDHFSLLDVAFENRSADRPPPDLRRDDPDAL